MRKGSTAALVIAALVLGLAVGSVGLATAATRAKAPAAGTAAGTPGAGFGRGMMGGRGGMAGAGGGMLSVVSKLTGESTSTILAALQGGKSFADVAKTKGVSAEEIVDLALKAPKAALDSRVSSGLITRAQADSILADREARMTERVNGTAPTGGGACGGGGGRGGRGGGLGGGCGGGGCGQTAPPTSSN